MRSRRPRTLTSVVAVGALSLLAAGCGGVGAPGVANVASSTIPTATGPSPTATSRAQVLLVAGRCLRRHGMPDLPDPTIASSGPAKGYAVLDKGFLRAIPESVVNQALLACHTALQQARIYNGPNAGANPREIQNLLAFARCVRRHGITNFPDPDSQGGFDLAGTGINSHQLSPSELAVAMTCLPTARGAVHLPPQGTDSSNSGQ